MFSDRLPLRGHSRVTIVALVACATWLLLQNSLLLLWLSSQHVAPLFVVMRALTRVGMHLAAEFWMLPAAVVLGVALALTGVEREGHKAGVPHVG